jgi:hypothetical protein
MTREDKLMQLIGAVDFNKVDAVTKILQEGVHVNYICTDENEHYYGQSPLLYCIRIAGISQFDVDFEVLELLLKHGADIHVRDDEGNSCALVAVKYFALQTLDTLIQHGANIHDQNTRGENAFDTIVLRYEEEQQSDVAHLHAILEADRKKDILEGRGEAFERMLERIDAIVKQGYDLNAGHESAAFVAVTAISEDRMPPEALEYLFEKGSDARECKDGPLLAYAMFRKLPHDTILSMMQR